LDRALAGSDVVVTGEGSLDRTSLSGKVVGEVLARASVANVGRQVAVAGRIVRAEVSSLSRSGFTCSRLPNVPSHPPTRLPMRPNLLTDAVTDTLEWLRP
jgi:hypothetical protein